MAHVIAKFPDFWFPGSLNGPILCSEPEGNMRAKDQQVLKAQDSLREAQEDLARDEVIFAGKVKELQNSKKPMSSCRCFRGQLLIKLGHHDDMDWISHQA